MAMVLVSCDQRQPKLSEEQVRKLKAAMPGITDACLDKVRWGGIEAMPPGLDKCFKMTPQGHWAGLWENGFESSRFCPAPATECSGPAGGEYIWLSASPGVRLPTYQGEDRAPIYAVEFLGRKTAYRGVYSGGAPQEIIVDRMISMTKLKE